MGVDGDWQCEPQLLDDNSCVPHSFGLHSIGQFWPQVLHHGDSLKHARRRRAVQLPDFLWDGTRTAASAVLQQCPAP